MFTNQYVIRHVKGTDQTVSLTLYNAGVVLDWTEYDPDTSTLKLNIRELGGTNIKAVTLTGSDFPTTTDGVAGFALADSDFSTTDVGEYVWWIEATLAAASGESPTLTGDTILTKGRIVLHAPDWSDATPA